MRFFAQLVKGKVEFYPAQEILKDQFLSRIKEFSPLLVDISVRREPKTQQQLGAFWSMVIARVIDEFESLGFDTSYLLRLPEPTGVAISPELLKEYLYAVCPQFDDNGKRVGLSKMNTLQAAKFFDDTRNFISSQWGIWIPEPDKNWRNKDEATE